MKYILVSYFNSNNLGDILLSKMIYENLIEDDIKVVACSFEGDFLKPKDCLYKEKILKRFIRKIFFSDFLLWFIFKIQLYRSDGLIIGGGNMVMDISTYSTLDKFQKYIELSLKYNKKVLVPFVGIGPIQDLEKFQEIKKLISKSQYVSVRDSSSFQYIKEFQNVSCTYDPAFLLKKRKLDKNNTILINVINSDVFDPGHYKIYETFYFELIKNILLKEKGVKITLVITEVADYKMVISLKRRFESLSNIDYFIPKTTEELIDTISKSKYAIGSRMHFMIIAYTQCIPFIGLKWQEKINGFFENIKMKKNLFDFDDKNINSMIEYIGKKEFLDMYKETDFERQNTIQKNIVDNFNEMKGCLK